jgi:GGDEF domain-containing protein
VTPRISIGAAVADGQDRNSTRLLQHADAAMYAVKRDRRL